jgi:DNA polymerase III subunit delta'
MAVGFLPWQTAFAQRWLQRQSSLPHAMLIHGLSGTGKREFALGMAQALLCERRAPDSPDFACGQCDACRWSAVGNHPDLMHLRPAALAAREGAEHAADEASLDEPAADGSSTTKKKLSEDLRVDQIRALEPWYHRATHRGGLRIVVLYPAEAMNTIAANALLKALEEPSPETLFLLVTDAPDRLLATILSRCQRLTIPMPTEDQSLSWLAQQGIEQGEAGQWLAAAGHAPLRALALSEQQSTPCPPWASDLMTGLAKSDPRRGGFSVGVLADELAKSAPVQWLPVFQRLCVDLTLARAGLPVRYYPKLSAVTGQRAQQASLEHWSLLVSWLNSQLPLATHPLNAKLFAHACLQRFCD